MPAKAAKKKNLSALKRSRQAERRRLRNSTVRSRIKTLSRRIQEAASEKSKEKLQKLLTETTKVVMSAVSKGIIHKNTASRKISRLSKLAKTILSA